MSVKVGDRDGVGVWVRGSVFVLVKVRVRVSSGVGVSGRVDVLVLVRVRVFDGDFVGDGVFVFGIVFVSVDVPVAETVCVEVFVSVREIVVELVSDCDCVLDQRV